MKNLPVFSSFIRFVSLLSFFLAFLLFQFYTIQSGEERGYEAGAGTGFGGRSAHAAETEKESAYDRVMRTGTIRCGYVVWAPYLLKDPNTGEYSGIAYDIMNAMAAELDLDLEWVEETGWGNFHEGLNNNRYDMMCVPVWQSGQRAKIALLSDPVYYIGLYAFAREDDNRFNDSFAQINKPDVTVAVVDGDATQAVRQTLFPKAKELSMPQFADSAQVVLSTALKKADVGLESPTVVRKYNETADVKLKRAGGGQPVRLFGNVFAVKRGEYEFQNVLNATIGALNTAGTLRSISLKYAPEIVPVIPYYDVPESLKER